MAKDLSWKPSSSSRRSSRASDVTFPSELGPSMPEPGQGRWVRLPFSEWPQREVIGRSAVKV